MALKIKPEHLDHMRQALAKWDTPFYRERYKAAGLSDMRFRGDALRAAGLMPWVCSDLYAYLNDEHIDSALRHLVKSLYA